MSEHKVYDVLILGGGPAGLSAATVLARQLHTTVIFDNKRYHNEKTKHMHNLATWDHRDPAEFRAAALRDVLEHYQTNEYVQTEIIGAKKLDDGAFELTDASGKVWMGKKLILAHGVSDEYLPIDGYGDCWAVGVFHCLFCHGYEQRGSTSSGVLAIGLCASAPHALTMARNASQLTSEVTIYTHGDTELTNKIQDMANSSGSAKPFKFDHRVITKLIKGANDADVTVEFEDGSQKHEAFLAHAPRTVVNGPFVSQLGLETAPSGDIKVNPPFQQTSVRGVFAAGDCSGPFKTVPNAIASGGMVAAGAAMQVQAEKHGHTPMF